MLPTKPGCCQFCPVRPGVPAVHRWADAFGHDYHLCQRHYWPLERWVRRRQLAAADLDLTRMVERLERALR